jgi:uncharacterized Zn finger protein
MGFYGWGPYVSVAEKREKARREMERMRKKGRLPQPIHIEGNTIARTFWGKAWCGHLEGFSDFENRLPRGRSYVRNGSVCHLEIAPGTVMARVSGSRLYTVEIGITPLAPAAWKLIKTRCTGGIASILDLLQGRLSEGVMRIVTDPDKGLFPKPREIGMSCSCPDYATMCKHVAAVLYGVGARLDESPELLFLLRGVKHEELIGAKAEAAVEAVLKGGTRRRLKEADLGEVFGVDLDDVPPRARSEGGRPASLARPIPAQSPAPRHGGAKARRTVKHPAFPALITGRHIAAMRNRLGLTGKDFADLLEVSGAAVSVWEGSVKPIRLRVRTRLALQREWDRSWRG